MVRSFRRLFWFIKIMETVCERQGLPYVHQSSCNFQKKWMYLLLSMSVHFPYIYGVIDCSYELTTKKNYLLIKCTSAEYICVFLFIPSGILWLGTRYCII